MNNQKNMTKKIKWRLNELPDAEELRDLVKDDILTKDEAREILFTEETEEDRDKKSLQSEIKFLRELVERLSKGNNTTIIETIRTYEKPYQRWDWYQPYQVWCSNTTNAVGGSADLIGNSTTTAVGSNSLVMSTAQSNSSFGSISTF